MSTRIYPFQFVSPLLGTLTIQCQMPKEAAEKLASTLRSTVQIADGRWFYELTGVRGQETHKNGPFRLLFGTEEKAKLADEAAYIQDLTAFWGSLPNPITIENAPAVEDTTKRLFEQHCPVVDKTETLQEVQARQTALAAAEAAQQHEREKLIAAYADNAEEIALEKGEMGVAVALVYDNSDMMTDYYHPRSVKHEFLLARMRPQRRQERLLRQVIARYPALKAIEWTWHGRDKYSHGPDCYLKSKGTFDYLGTPFKAYAGHEVTRVWYEIRFVRSGRYLPYQGFHPPSHEASGADPHAQAASSATRIERDRNWTWIFFPEKPAEMVLERLGRMGAHWGTKRGGWYFKWLVPDEELAWVFETPEPEMAETTPEAATPSGVRERSTPGPAGYIPGKGSAFDYIPAWMEVPPPYATEKQEDPLAVIKLFTPDSSWNWFILEYDGQDICFGLVAGHDTEFGDFSLREIEAARGPLGVQPERDLWFCPTPVTQLPEYQAKWGSDGPFRGGGDSSAALPEPKPPDSPPPALPQAAAVPLPEGWTEEDIHFLLEKVTAQPILVGDTRLGLPTIHDFIDAEHLGYGLFRVNGEGFTLQFDGGKAMQRTPSGKGWTPLEIRGDYAYAFEGVRAVLQAYLAPPDPTKPPGEVLTESEALSILEETTSFDQNPAQTLTTQTLAAMARVRQATILPDEDREEVPESVQETRETEGTLSNPHTEKLTSKTLPEPVPDDLVEFAQWELALLTGLVHKSNSAFHRALKAVTRPATLHLALAQVNGDERRRELIENRLAKLKATDQV